MRGTLFQYLEVAVRNTLEASQVMALVLNRYEQYLPAGLGPTVRGSNPARIFRILPEAEYKPYFAAVFRNFFAAVNVSALGMRMIGVANSPTSPYDGGLACPAFCSPAVRVTDRTIYVNRDAGVTVGTLYHEFIHYLSHGNFYPEFYSLGGRNPAILEGVTEYLTRRISPAIEHDRASQNKYQQWFTDVGVAMGGNPANTLNQFAALAFQGDMAIVPTLGGVAPRV